MLGKWCMPLLQEAIEAHPGQPTEVLRTLGAVGSLRHLLGDIGVDFVGGHLSVAVRIGGAFQTFDQVIAKDAVAAVQVGIDPRYLERVWHRRPLDNTTSISPGMFSNPALKSALIVLGSLWRAGTRHKSASR